MRVGVLSAIVVLAAGCGSKPGESTDTGAPGDSGELIETGGETGGETGEVLSPDEQSTRDAYNAIKSSLSEANISNTDRIADWASASAPNAFLNVYLPVLLIQSHIANYQAEGNTGLPACPALTGFDQSGQPTGAEWSAEGGCVDHMGTEWTGSYVLTMQDPYTAEMVADGFGQRTPSMECSGKVDSYELKQYITMSSQPDGSMSLDILVANVSETAMASAGCELVESGLGFDVELSRQVEQIDGSEKSTYSHEGEALFQEYTHQGYLNVETENEVVHDAVCSTEALSGTTTVSNSTDTAVITYDGETDCKEEGTVTWSLNGAQQGEVSGVSCASSRKAPGSWLLALGALVFLRGRRQD